MKIVIWGIGASAFLLLGLTVGSRNVEVLVPRDLRGLVRVSRSPTAPNPTLGVMKLVVHVRESGELQLPDLDVVRRMHRQTAVFSDGTPLPVALPGDTFEGLALQVMNTPLTQQVFWFVGTQDEATAYLKTNGNQLYSTDEEASKRVPAR